MAHSMLDSGGALLIIGVAFLVVRVLPPRWRLPLWTLVIVGGVVPWIGFQSHSHWSRVVWIPFTSRAGSGWDVAANVALYIPFGLFLARRGDGRVRRLPGILVGAALLAVVTELSQVYSHGRFPSASDAALNVIGAWLGAVWGRAGGRASGPGPPIRH